MKRTQLIGIILAVIAIGGAVGGGYWYFNKPKAAPAPAPVEKKKKVSEPINAIPETERPYIGIAPSTDGRNILITVFGLKKTATEAEYELEYQAGSLLQGAFGTIKLEKTPVENKILLGSCSAGGACTYHTEVQGGTLVTRYTGPENYALKTEWKYIENKTKETAFSSKDAKFQITSTDLAKQKILVIANSPGYPGDPKATVVSDHYTLATADELKGKAKVNIRAKVEGKHTIMGWNGQGWVSFTTTTDAQDPKVASAEVDLLPLYVVTQ